MGQIAAAAAASGAGSRISQTTQLVVGAGEETDQEIGRAAQWLYRELHLARVYYSGFRPLPGTPLAERPPTSPRRAHRLYQLDFLLRSYGFSVEELGFDDRGLLPLSQDPKTAWAQAHPEHFPVEVNAAPLATLLRVPGIGPRSARRLLALRREGPLRRPEVLKAAGTCWNIAAPFVLLDGRRWRLGPQLPLLSAR